MLAVRVAGTESIENRWDFPYRDYPEVYEAFSSTPCKTSIVERLPEIILLLAKAATMSDQKRGNRAASYGFILGKKVIEHLRREKKTTIRWMFRVYWKGA